MKNVWILLCVGVLILSCEKQEVDRDITQPVLFEYEYVNHAWVYTHFGWMIDDQGKVVGYNLPKAWTSMDHEGYISKDDLLQNYQQSDTVYTTVDGDKLLDQFDHRFDVINTRLDTADSYMADAGVGALYVYVWNTKKNKYQRQLLAMKGDLSISNNRPQVKSMVDWLISVGKQTDRFFWFDQ